MPNPTLIKHLRIRPGQRLLVLNAPPGYLENLGELPEGAWVETQAQGKYEFVQVFVKDSQEFQELYPAAQAAVEFDGMLWVCYPKKTGAIQSDLSRDIIWDRTRGSGLRPVAQISIDETWSALRYRPDEKVGK